MQEMAEPLSSTRTSPHTHTRTLALARSHSHSHTPRKVGSHKGRGRKGGDREPRKEKGGGSEGMFVEFWWCFLKAGASNMHVWAFLDTGLAEGGLAGPAEKKTHPSERNRPVKKNS